MSRTAPSPAAARVLAQVGIVRESCTTEQPSIPMPDVTLFTLTENEVYDLVYAAASTQLRSHTMPISTAQKYAAEIANRACALALASDARHEGHDPRA
jgi:hypothetical protein